MNNNDGTTTGCTDFMGICYGATCSKEKKQKIGFQYMSQASDSPFFCCNVDDDCLTRSGTNPIYDDRKVKCSFEGYDCIGYGNFCGSGPKFQPEKADCGNHLKCEKKPHRQGPGGWQDVSRCEAIDGVLSPPRPDMLNLLTHYNMN